MPRYFVYVNNNPNRKHITLHPETSGACPYIFQHICIGEQYEGSFEIENLDQTFKTAETSNGYWLIAWAADPLAVLNNTQVKNAEKGLGVRVCVCSKCE